MTDIRFQGCGKAGSTYNFNLTGFASGKQYLLSLTILSYNGMGTYNADQITVNFHAYPTATSGLWADNTNVQLPASVSVNAGENTGSINATLADTSSSTHLPNVEISGNWICPSGSSGGGGGGFGSINLAQSGLLLAQPQ